MFFFKLLDSNNILDYTNFLLDQRSRNNLAKTTYLSSLFNISWNKFINQSKVKFENGYTFQNFYNITIRAYRNCANELCLNENLIK